MAGRVRRVERRRLIAYRSLVVVPADCGAAEPDVMVTAYSREGVEMESSYAAEIWASRDGAR